VLRGDGSIINTCHFLSENLKDEPFCYKRYLREMGFKLDEHCQGGREQEPSEIGQKPRKTTIPKNNSDVLRT
jgi:hypothetical protein